MLTAPVCAVALAACGSSGRPSTAASKGYSQFLVFAKCMRAHGVSNLPDPKAGGGGIQITSGSGVNLRSPAFQSAQAACRKDLPGGGPSSGPPSPQAHAQLLKVSECMRAHGISDFPDPSTGTPPTPGTGSSAAVIARGGYFLAIPSSINMQSPAFRQAAKACHPPL